MNKAERRALSLKHVIPSHMTSREIVCDRSSTTHPRRCRTFHKNRNLPNTKPSYRIGFHSKLWHLVWYNRLNNLSSFYVVKVHDILRDLLEDDFAVRIWLKSFSKAGKVLTPFSPSMEGSRNNSRSKITWSKQRGNTLRYSISQSCMPVWLTMKSMY